MKKIPENARTEPGWALARVGDGGWWPAIERGLAAGQLGDEIATGLADVVRGAGVRPGWVTAIPSARLADGILDRLAERIATDLGVPYVALVERTGSRPPQRDMANAVQQAANVRGAFKVTGAPPPGAGLLIDDRRLSGWTMAMVGGQLRRQGGEAIVPLALATLN
jgi:ATP-dependent DNA helicase RecQ